MEGILFLAIMGAVMLTWLKYRHERNMKQLDASRGQTGPALQQLHYATQQVQYLEAAKSELEQRVQNLETIVCSVDFELNAKLNRLASRQLALTQTAPSAEEMAATEGFSLTAISAGARVAGRFVVEKQLGTGGMGAVYLARDEQLDEMVALKVIAGAALLDPAAADRFRREAATARRISHKSVVRIHDIGEEKGMLFLSMEYIHGTSVADLLRRHGTLPLTQLADIVRQVCAGLEAAHQAGVVHRDLKPGNILIDENQQVKIIDFGLARMTHLEGMTATGLILGTPEYMAPEQIRGRPVDARTDVYALGAVIYHALVGHPPFSGVSPIAIGFAHCNEQLVPANTINPQVPEAWSQLASRALAKDPADRFDSASQLAAAVP